MNRLFPITIYNIPIFHFFPGCEPESATSNPEYTLPDVHSNSLSIHTIPDTLFQDPQTLKLFGKVT